MSDQDIRPPDLSSWKEIAAYLGVSVRAAQSWERDRGLPVRRLPGGRGRVFASVADLDTWKRSGDGAGILLELATSPVAATPVLVVPKAGRRALLALLVVLVLALALGARFLRPVDPVSCRLEPHSLVVMDGDGHVLWHRVFPYELTEVLSPNPGLSSSWVGDLAGDGHAEVLFYPRGTLPAGGSPPLICYAPSGRERWRFVPSRRVATRTASFEPVYMVSQFVVGRVRPNGPLRIVVASSHYLHAPSQIALLDADGHVLREYWHYGQLNHLAMADLNGDGKSEIYAAGISNAWNAATLVVLDPETFGGASQESEHPDAQLLGFPPARELARIILPRSCLNRERHQYNGVNELYAQDGTITVDTGEMFGNGISFGSVIHHFNGTLTSHRVTISDGYANEYGKVPPALRNCPLDDPELHEVRVITPLR